MRWGEIMHLAKGLFWSLQDNLSEWLASLKHVIPTPAEPATNYPHPVRVVELEADYSLDTRVEKARGTILIIPFYDKLPNAIWNHK
jgi:hypothetical protein